METISEFTSCGSKQPCDFSIDGGASCHGGDGSCAEAYLLDADASEFHDQTLMDATKQISEILESIPPDSQGRKLSFLHTRMGTMLAWVNHGAKEVSPNAVTAKDEDDTLARALRLKGYTAAGAAQGR